MRQRGSILKRAKKIKNGLEKENLKGQALVHCVPLRAEHLVGEEKDGDTCIRQWRADEKRGGRKM